MIAGFKKFIMQGSVVDLAVGVVVGVAFNALIAQFTTSFLDPIIRLVTGGGIDGGTFTINDQVFDYGAFVTAIITFVLTLAAVYFAIVVPMNALRDRRKTGAEEEAEPTDQEKMIALLEQIANK